jgi:hypothetical protein
MTLKLTHIYNDAIEVAYGDQPLLRYVYMPDTPQVESPRPYIHPLYTLSGNLVTNVRPHDHVWHKGLSMTMAVLSGQNFWGGPTYVDGQGYVQLDNNGRMDHRAWETIDYAKDAVALVERLDWITRAGEHWIAEMRRIAIRDVNAVAGQWTLDFACRLTNVRGEPLVFGSPTTEGRALAGYGGLFWRGPRSFRGGEARAAGDLSGDEIMGERAPWLAYSGLHDGSGDRSTLLFLDHPANLRYPTQWFMRCDPFACASFAFSFDEEYTLPPDETLALRYRMVIADGALTEAQIEQHAAQWQEVAAG